jgi:hypothetical protein
MGAVATRRSYTEAEIQRGLTEVAACSGNARLASKHLAEEGLEIDNSILYRWKTKLHAEKYEAIRDELLPSIRRQAADMHAASAAKRMELADEISEKLKEKLPELDAKDLSTAMRNTDVGAGIHSQNAEKLNEQTAPRPAQNFGAMLREFKQMTGIDISLKVPEKEEIQDAEVVEVADV